VRTWFWWGDLRDRDNSEDLSADGRMILKRNSRNGMEGMDWVALAQDRDRRQPLVNAVMNFRVTG
jgi:hypothetical protein